ncbi:hypothetical protein Q3G72_024300 [Acer saccharum]|nr:hypothetical protein Q3G72_024300 [Acer saccharum]
MSSSGEDRKSLSLEEDRPPPPTPDLDPPAKKEARKDEPRLFHTGLRTLTQSSAKPNSNPTQDARSKLVRNVAWNITDDVREVCKRYRLVTQSVSFMAAKDILQQI